MLAVTLEQPKSLTLADVPDAAAPGRGQARVRTHRMGVCGTDVGGYLGKMPFFSYPRVIGHELGVEVLDVGEGVANVSPGDRCCVRPYVVCGACYACRSGAVNCCAKSQTLGVMCDGGGCETFTLDASLLHPSDKLTYEQLALVETLGIGCHAVDRSGVQEGDHALVIGAGPIGLSALEFAKVAGAKVTVMDLAESRLAFCREHYGTETIVAGSGDAEERMRSITGGDLYPVVIDATGHAGSMAAAPGYLAQTGTLVYVGITQGDFTLHHPTVHRPEATIRASRNALPKDFTRIIDLIERGVIDTDRWITHRTPVAELPETFETFCDPGSGVIKAMVELT